LKKILYIGNKLSDHGNTATSIETLGNFLEIENYKVYYASSKKNIIFRMLDMIYKTIFLSRKMDYVLIDTYSTLNFWYALIISQLCRVLNLKYIPKLHGGDLPKRLNKDKFLCSLIFKNAYLNIAPSAYLYEAFLENGYTNIKYIPNTIALNKYKFKHRNFDFPRILWVRSFAQIYNPLMAVKVLLQVKKIYPNATLCMVGPIKDESYEQTLEFTKINNVDVVFTGKLSKKKWISLSNDYNVFINTTHYDNTPVSVIEALALGLPVVSTNVGGIPFLLEHEINALLSNDDDHEEMVLQIVKLFENNDLSKQLTNNGLELVKSFDWDIVKKDWKNLLK